MNADKHPSLNLLGWQNKDNSDCLKEKRIPNF